MQEDVGAGWDEPLGLALPPGTQVAGFTLEAQLATGGAGTVYRARRGALRVALKVIPKDDWGEREVDALRRVQHAPVVGLLGYGGWPEPRSRYLALALELVEGLALDAWAREHNPSARQLVHQVLLPLVEALGQVHAVGVVHRDVKEANVVVRQADGRPVLVDFGAACYEGAPRLTERLPPGTREYRSPEMWRFARDWDGSHYLATPADDLWALGVTLYWLLTRELPFGDRSGPLVERVLEQDPRPVHELNPRVPETLGALCLRMLSRELADRHPHALALAEALEEVLAQADGAWEEPLFAPEPSSPGVSVTEARVPPVPAVDPEPPKQEGPKQEPPRVHRERAMGAGLVLLTGLLGLLSWRLVHTSADPDESSGAPRTASSRAAPPLQDGARQEVALGGPTGEVGSHAGPEKSPPPAPVARATHPEEAPVFKSHKARSTLASALAAGSLCGGGGCVSAPQPIADSPPPPPIPCPAGDAQTYRVHNTEWAVPIEFEHPPYKWATVHNGGVLRVTLLNSWGDIPAGTPLVGRVWFGRDRVYGRLTEVLLSSGERLPICLHLSFNEPGVPMLEGSTRTDATINKSANAVRESE